MTDTIAALPGAAVSLDSEPRCEAMLQCTEKCCDPVRCRRPAVARVSFRCKEPACDRATHMMLLCSVCADRAAACMPPPTRRPL